MKTAILIDGGFFLKRYSYIEGFDRTDPPEVVAKNLVLYCFKHINKINSYRNTFNLPHQELYRIFYYDAKPYDGDSMNILTGKTINFKNTDQYKFRSKLFEELKRQRKIALRLGFLKNSSNQWVIKSKYTKDIITGKLPVSDITEVHLEFPLKQKAVDMKIGLDIASLAHKSQVSQIILIAGDSDFVPAAKFARREGIDFILDPMLNNIDPGLYEHIDGLMTIKKMTKKEIEKLIKLGDDSEK